MDQEHSTWIALYTRPRHERSVGEQLQRLGMESYVPLRQEIRRWSDRRKKVLVPLIPSYVFVHLDPGDHHRVFAAHGIVRVVAFNGRIAVVRPSEIELLRAATRYEHPVSISTASFHENDPVEIVDGLFKGYCGRVVHADKMYTVGIRIEELGCSLLLEVPTVHVRLSALSFEKA